MEAHGGSQVWPDSICIHVYIYIYMWKRTIGWLCPFSSRCKEVWGQPQRDRGRTSGTMCTCWEIERGTHAYRASKLGPVERWWTQDGKLGITIQDPPPESWRRTHFCVIRIAFCHVSEICHFIACFTSLRTSIYVFYINTPRDVVTVLLMFVTYVFLYLHICICTYRGTHAQAHMYYQHTRGMATTRRRSLVERGGRKASVRDKGLANTQKGRKI